MASVTIPARPCTLVIFAGVRLGCRQGDTTGGHPVSPAQGECVPGEAAAVEAQVVLLDASPGDGVMS